MVLFDKFLLNHMLLQEELGVSIQHKVLVLEMLGLVRLDRVYWLLLLLGGGA